MLLYYPKSISQITHFLILTFNTDPCRFSFIALMDICCKQTKIKSVSRAFALIARLRLSYQLQLDMLPLRLQVLPTLLLRNPLFRLSRDLILKTIRVILRRQTL